MERQDARERALGRPTRAIISAPLPAFMAFIANIYFYQIETPLGQFVVSHENIVQHCRAIHDAVMAKQV
jgi:hypothetical protein